LQILYLIEDVSMMLLFRRCVWCKIEICRYKCV